MKKTVIYKNDDQFNIEADFYGTHQSNSPVIIYIHGGGLLWGEKEEISKEMIQLFTSNGYGLFSINYRLAPETKLQDTLDDIKVAIKWLESEGQNQLSIDPRKIAVIGSSAGGFLALSAGNFETKPRAIVSFYGYGDISAEWATNPNDYYRQKDLVSKEMTRSLISKEIITNASLEKRFLLYLHARQTGEWIQEITGINPTLNKEALIKLSPIYHIAKDYPPTLLLHGTNDVDVPYLQSVFMRAALIKENIQTKLITIPNGEHVFEKDFYNPVVQNALQEVIDFLHVHLSD
ncbi:alpha/beta hydrolase [Psychrobacillus antarcticus]|uniref:alpha/beta hydrolase n=1 Tax=Psychrobacillus antarcticus TaxID=2879115 RepID=UPI0024087019|nr:alpha/beta hydrolase [Psychrobacillus antarcticus]